MPAMRKLTPVLTVERIEPCLEFWTALGFRKTAEVPEGDHLGFAILATDQVEIMYQTRRSVANDLPAVAAELEGSTRPVMFFLETDDLDGVERALGGATVVVPRRTTFYGMAEVGVREPGGNLVIFAQPVEQDG